MTLFWNTLELKQMHIELTNACNAACPMCVRFHCNSPLTRPDLEIGQITIDKFKKYFPVEVLQNCELIMFCGVHGDPCVARDMLEICEYIDEVSPQTAIRVNTNGGMRKPEWWSKLGKLFEKHRRTATNFNWWSVTFSIDGLEDTNHLYRRNVEWKKLTANAQAFIDGGGTAIWDFLIFRHNEHQLDHALETSKQMGFAEFIPKKALGVDDGTRLEKMPVLNKNGELDYVIEAPTDPKNRNLENPQGEKELKFYPFTPDGYRYLKDNASKDNYKSTYIKVYDDKISKEDREYVKDCDIKCKSKTWSGNKEIFVDNFGRVLPCCYVGTHLNGTYGSTPSLQLHYHMDNYGWDNFSLEKHSLYEIISAGHLDRVFADSWTKGSAKDGKMIYCADTCGTRSSIDKIFTHESNNKADELERKKRERENVQS